LRARGKIRKILFYLLLWLFLGSNVFGTIAATYTPASYLNFKKGDEVSRLPATPLGTFSSTKLVAYLGTIVITRDVSDAYYRPVLVNYDSVQAIYVRGPLSGWGGGIHDTQFNVYAKNSMRNEAHPLWLHDTEANLYSDNWNLNPQITDNPFIIDLFLVSHQPASLYILSTAPWENPSAWSDKLNWVKRYLGNSAHKRLILSHNKNLNRGDILIDDRTANGAGQFKGTFIKFGSTQFPNWESTLPYVIQLLEE
jgi:hypothetical protein